LNRWAAAPCGLRGAEFGGSCEIYTKVRRLSAQIITALGGVTKNIETNDLLERITKLVAAHAKP
jgi:hypothetical protein